MLRRNKIQGLLVGGAIGDAWGMVVEGLKPDTIKKKYPDGVRKYERPDGHKFFDGLDSGTITDDTILTVATISAIKQLGTLDINSIVSTHVMALKANPAGWGKTTEEAILLMKDGVPYYEAGHRIAKSVGHTVGYKNSRGYGNGVLMKAGALGAFCATEAGGNYKPDKWPSFNQFCVEFAKMTHFTKMAAMSGVIHANVIHSCLHSDPEQFDVESMFDFAADTAWSWGEEDNKGDPSYYDLEYLFENDDNLKDRMVDLWENRKNFSGWTPAKIRDRYGASPYTLHSMPFSYAMFAKNPYSAFQAGFDVVNQGGDSDTNAKIVLELIGSLHGVEVFQTDENHWMVDGLTCYEKLMELADQFCDQFGVN